MQRRRDARIVWPSLVGTIVLSILVSHDPLSSNYRVADPAFAASPLPEPDYSSTSASGSIVRISKIEIIGRNRINRNKRAKNKPILPAYMDQSQNEG